ncbi:MAG: FliA/WhiG family RNA polymerase sigma factor [Myxococcales bacterium]|nr:FliA/WhiG family RNA polymerase sigma factor [Myxococcales bacterium]MCB9536334.1 FliA/WhiG family RNA polymerase sigma factor [Myxococcales bacterium]
MKHGIQAYQKNAALSKRRQQEEQVRKYAPLVKKVAYRLIHRLPPSVEVEDLISVGTIGLLHAIDNFDATKGSRFEAYAEFRIKGAMLDELRSYDFMSRTARGKANKLERSRQRLENQLGRQPSVAELAEDTGLDASDVETVLASTGQVAFLTLEDLSAIAADATDVPWELLSQARPDDPFGHTFFRELREALVEALEGLPERLKLVMSLYYYNELNFKEIGRVLDLTESRISQLHTQAVQTLRKRLRKAV